MNCCNTYSSRIFVSLRDEESVRPAGRLHVADPRRHRRTMRTSSFRAVDLLDDVRVADVQLPAAAPPLSKHLPVLAM